jgi:hypothetical protein
VAALSKAWVYGRSLTGIVGSNPAGGMDVCCECCMLSGLRRAGHSSRGVLPTVVCLKCVIVKPRKMRRDRPPRGCRAIGKKKHKKCPLWAFKACCSRANFTFTFTFVSCVPLHYTTCPRNYRILAIHSPLHITAQKLAIRLLKCTLKYVTNS